MTGSFDIVRAKSFGVKIGLGTDCSGGYHPSILDAMRQDFIYSLLIAVGVVYFDQPLIAAPPKIYVNAAKCWNFFEISIQPFSSV